MKDNKDKVEKIINPILTLLSGLIVFIVAISVVVTIYNLPEEKDWECEELKCSKTSLDIFNHCEYLGFESSGFLSTNEMYLCDGFKIAYSCLEKEYVKTEKEIKRFTDIEGDMRCEENER